MNVNTMRKLYVAPGVRVRARDFAPRLCAMARTAVNLRRKTKVRVPAFPNARRLMKKMHIKPIQKNSKV